MNQLSIAYKQCDQGMARAAQGAENAVEGWTDLALDFLKRYAETHERFPAFFVTAAAETEPTLAGVNPKAWGPVVQTAMKRGIIAKTDSTMPHPGRHACPAYVFRSLVCKVSER